MIDAAHGPARRLVERVEERYAYYHPILPVWADELRHDMIELRLAADARYARYAALVQACEELTAAMQAYQMDVEDEAPFKHRKMLERARAALAALKGGERE